MEKISYTIDGQKITGHIIFPKIIKEKNPAILFIHGWLSNEKGYVIRAKALADLGFIGMTINLRGQGTSEGDINSLSRNDFSNDVITAYDFLTKQKNVDRNEISVVGASFGGYLGTLLTAERKIKNLAIRVPANYPDQDGDLPHILASAVKNPEVLPWRNQKLSKNENKALKVISEFAHPVLIIESENDSLIPHQTVQNYVDAIPDKSLVTYKLMKHTPHNLATEEQQQIFIDILTEWFKNKK